MALSVTRYKGDGRRREFTFSFTGADKGYLRDSDVYVFIDRKEAGFRLTSPSSIELLPTEETPAVGAEIEIRRIMPKDKNFAEFKKGNNFRESVLNNTFLQLLYLVHELLDGYFSGNVEFQDDVSFLNDVLINGTLGVRGDTTLHRLLVEGGASISDFLRVIRNTPNDQQTVMNIAGNDDRYLRKEGGTTGILNATRMTVQEVGTTSTSVINRAFADNRYYKNTGGKVSGVVDATHSGVLTKDPSEPDSAVNKRTLDAVVSDLDTKILGMKSNAEELLAAIAEAILEGTLGTSCNTPVLYHKRFLDAPVVVPEGCEARTFGSELKILEGGSLYLGAGTRWRFFNDDGKTP